MTQSGTRVILGLVFHYDEIAFKGGNRKAYERVFQQRVGE
ncbi:MAG: hypothetical protein KatS3mg100_391 [Candidatus Parcubacteria bacterium]|nr:MAG: hypothetical protein KatS3mg100_391 [Candidatus Parcubacteria bacterium]